MTMPQGDHYAIIYEPGPNWLPGKPTREQPLKDHLAHLLRHGAEGRMTMGGPFLDNTGGLVIVVAESAEVPEQIVREDPGIVAGILKASIHKWKRYV
jgi:uncharacterized protein YciI